MKTKDKKNEARQTKSKQNKAEMPGSKSKAQVKSSKSVAWIKSKVHSPEEVKGQISKTPLGIKPLNDNDYSVSQFSNPTTESDIKEALKKYSTTGGGDQTNQIGFNNRKSQSFSFLKYSSPRVIDEKHGNEGTNQNSDLLSSETPTLEKWPYDYRPIVCKNIVQNELQRCLNKIFPPKEWTVNGESWQKTVSPIPASRTEVIKLKEDFDKLLQNRQAKIFGLCSIRLDLYLQCFDEMIRQATICCTERGLLLAKVRDTIKSTLWSYHSVYESSCALGFRKTMNHEEELASLSDSIGRIIKERNVIRNKIVETDAKIETVRQFMVTHSAQEEIKHIERMFLLRKANDHLKAALIYTAEHGPKKSKAAKAAVAAAPTSSKSGTRGLQNRNSKVLAVPGT